MKLLKLTDDDIAKLMPLTSGEMQLQSQLGVLRQDYIAHEAALMQQLTNLQHERTTLLSVLGRHYLRDQPAGTSYKFLSDQLAFAVEETQKEHT